MLSKVDIANRSTYWHYPVLLKYKETITSSPDYLNSLGTNGNYSLILKEISCLLKDKNEKKQMSAYLLCIEVFHSAQSSKLFAINERLFLTRSANKILNRAKIDTNGSNLSFLHRDLFNAISLGLDLTKLKETLRKKGTEVQEWLLKEPATMSEETNYKRIQFLRFTGDYFQAAMELEESLKKPESKLELLYKEEKLLQQLTIDGNLTAALKMKRESKEFYLWAYALSERKWISKIPKVEDEFLSVLKSLYNASLSKSERWALLVSFLSNNTELMTTQELALALACSIRWLLRMRESETAAKITECYLLLSLTLSNGSSQDILMLFENDKKESSEISIPTSWKRGSVLSSLTFEVICALGRMRFASLFGNDQTKKRLRDKEAEILIEIVVRHLSKLKGPIMKIGQTASYMGWQVPEISSKLLSSLQSEATSISYASVLKVLKSEFDNSIEDIFSEFEEEPFGVGSIGQVHRARLVTGEAVAVKIQYPNIKEAIQIDMSLLKVCFPILRILTASSLCRNIFEELEKQLLSECDYEKEAESLKRIASNFADLPELSFPKVFAKLSTKRILVTSLMEGKSFSEFVETASQEKKNNTSRLITEYVVRSCCNGIFNSDPHPGNFLFYEDKVVCLDFGAVKEWEAKYQIPWAELIYAGVKKDYELFKKAFYKMDIVKDKNNIDVKYFYNAYVSGAMGNTNTNSVARMAHSDLRREFNAYFNRSYLGHLYFNPNYLYGIRVYTGLISILSELNAEVNYSEQITNICHATMPSHTIE